MPMVLRTPAPPEAKVAIMKRKLMRTVILFKFGFQINKD
jgi:hypothetical protein